MPPVDTDVRPPANFAELITHNAEAGAWTEEEGLIRTLEFFAGQRTVANLPGAASLPVGEGTGVDIMAAYYLRNGQDKSVKAEINRLLDLVLPPQANLDHYSAPAPIAGDLVNASAQQQASASDMDCAAIWLQGLPTELPAPGPCLYYADRTVQAARPINLRVYYATDWQDDPEAHPYFEATLEAMEKSTIE